MPNAIAYVALLLWPLVAAGLFAVLPLRRALVVGLLGAYLFLPPPPAGFDLPLLPPLTKDTIPTLVAVAMCLLLARGPIRWWPASGIGKVLLAAFVFAPFLTVLTNQDPVFFGRIGLPGLRFREAISISLQQALLVAPMLLAQHFLTREKDQRFVLMALLAGGLVYSVLALVEVRLSPQLNAWIYGYYQHSFEQTLRFGGYRPLVFLYHGIWLAFFLMTAALAAVALVRTVGVRTRMGYALAAIYLLGVLFLCKSTGAILFAAAFVPVVAFLGRRMQLNIACVLAVIAVAYPVLKGADLVPVEQMLSLAEDISAERASSLRFRFQNEDILLDRASERPLFGWGSWGRNQIFDPITGDLLTVTDGRWIIVIGVFGWLGFLAEFGLLTLPIFVIWRRSMRGDLGLSPYVAPMALMLAINVIDLIPNATITPITFLLAGTLLGYSKIQVPQRRDEKYVAFETVL